jgi:hypothetical protein
VPGIHYQESSFISEVSWIAAVVFSLYPLTAEEDYRIVQGSIVQFQDILHHPYVVYRHVSCVLYGDIEDGSNATIVRLQSAGCLIVDSKMVPKCPHLCVLDCSLGRLCAQQQSVDINFIFSICGVAPYSATHLLIKSRSSKICL